MSFSIHFCGVHALHKNTWFEQCANMCIFHKGVACTKIIKHSCFLQLLLGLSGMYAFGFTTLFFFMQLKLEMHRAKTIFAKAEVQGIPELHWNYVPMT